MVTNFAPSRATYHHSEKNRLKYVIDFKLIFNIKKKFFTVVISAFCHELKNHSHIKDGARILNTIISIESAIQARPATKDNLS